MAPTFNIAALTRRTGVPSDTIRKWEQRYGVLSPTRTPGGQRRYTERDVARIEWLKARLEEGYRIGEAAALLGNGEVVAASNEELRAALVEAATSADVDALLGAVEQALLVVPLETAFTEVLCPALVEIGELWESGALSVAQEHLATATVRAALQRQLTDGRGAIRGVAVLACAPGERHEIGLLMLAVLMRADGWQVAYLGPDTPVADAVALAESIGAVLICFSAGSEGTASALDDELGHLTMPPSLRVVVGGRGTRGASATDAVPALR